MITICRDGDHRLSCPFCHDPLFFSYRPSQQADDNYNTGHNVPCKPLVLQKDLNHQSLLCTLYTSQTACMHLAIL